MMTTRSIAMIIAIYARKSTDQNGIADAEKSVTRQVERGPAYATRKGWTVADAVFRPRDERVKPARARGE